MKFVRKLFAFFTVLLLTAALLSSGLQGFAQEPYNEYTYWNAADGSTVAKPIQSMYGVDLVIDSESLGTDISSISDVCVDRADNIYILDGDGSAVFVLDSEYRLIEKITEVYDNGTAVTFSKSRGIYVDDSGFIYIADTEKARVIKFDRNLTVQYIFTLPKSEVIPDDFVYKPMKVSVDSDGYVYVLSDGSFYGAILYSPQQEFLGFFGSNNVESSILDVFTNLLQRLTMTNEKRARSASRLPYQIADIYVDSRDFVYTSTGMGTDSGQIKKFSRGGANIYGEDIKFGDNQTVVVKIGASYQRRYQNFISVAVDSNNFAYALDATYGRVFVYDSECNMVCAFGGGLGSGSQDGTFKTACAIDLKADGETVLVADSYKNTVTAFKLTEYGKLVKRACAKTAAGNYAESEVLWQQVLSLDKNCQLAYSGIASARYVEKDYETAAEYAKIGINREIYSNATAKLRTVYLKENFYPIVAILALILVGIIIAVRLLKKRGFRIRVNEKLKVFASTVTHPFDSFERIKQKGLGSVKIGLGVMAVFYVAEILRITACGFAFSSYDVTSFNSLFILIRTVGLVLLWTVANWGVCQLMSGTATFKETFITISYSLVPVVAGTLLYTLLSNFVSLSGEVFLNIISVVALLYTVFMLLVGTMKINDYSFGKFVLTTAITIAFMMLTVFLLFILVILAQQFFGFLTTLVTEITYF